MRTAAKFRQGEQVKVYIKRGLQVEPSWQIMTFQKKDGYNYVVSSGNYDPQLHAVSEEHIAKWAPLPMEQLDAFGKQHIKELFELIQRAAAELLNPSWKVTVSLNEEDYIINIMDGEITVQPEVIESRSILGFRECAGWGVSRWRPTLGNRYEPPDVEEINAGQARDKFSAASLAISTIFMGHAENFFQFESDNEYASAFDDEFRN